MADKNDQLELFDDLESELRKDLIKVSDEEYKDLISTTKWGRKITKRDNGKKKEEKALENKRTKNRKDAIKRIETSMKGQTKKMDTRIRDLDRLTWELFKQHCREESVLRGKTISANKRILEMIEMVVSQSF